MCFTSAPKVKPIAAPPQASPEVIDETAVKEKDRFRNRARGMYGRQATILAGNEAPPTAPVKTVLGS
jgi:hypothetical protein